MKRSAPLFCKLAAIFWAFPSHADDPPAPVGQDPGGDAIAVIGTGFDYVDSALAQRLARDGEGEPIGWDFANNDARPFAEAGKISSVAYAAEFPGARLILIQVDPASPVTLGQALAFVTRTPARAAILELGPLPRSNWEALRQAAFHFKNLKVYVPRCTPLKYAATPQDENAPILPEDLGLPNLSGLSCKH